MNQNTAKNDFSARELLTKVYGDVKVTDNEPSAFTRRMPEVAMAEAIE